MKYSLHVKVLPSTGMSTLRQAQAQATRRHLVEVATDLFSRLGYSVVTTTSLTEAAGVTRGALYHHFANMTEVMEAVLEQAGAALVAATQEALSTVTTPSERLLRLGPAVLDALAADPVVQRIVFVEAPTALGWTRWRALDGGRSLGLIVELLDELHRTGRLAPGAEPRMVAPLLLGAINEAAMFAASGEQRARRIADQLSLLTGAMLAPTDDEPPTRPARRTRGSRTKGTPS